MNRRERRAQAGGGGEPPRYYVLTCERMAQALQAWMREHPSDPPHFALPGDEDIVVIGALDELPAIARNEAARALVVRFCEIGRAITPGGVPTIHMLRTVLAHLRMPYERRPVTEFGTFRYSGQA